MNKELHNDLWSDLLNSHYQTLKVYSELLNKWNLKTPDSNTMAENVVRTFCSTNIRNIAYYKKEISKIKRQRSLYIASTILLVAAIPLFIFFKTHVASKFAEEGDLWVAGGMVTASVGSLIGLHKVMSEIFRKRKIRSGFYKAKVDLLTIFYDIQDKHAFLQEPGLMSKDQQKAKVEQKKSEISEGMLKDLREGSRKSRLIVSSETQEYFKIADTISFDLSNILSNSANTAKSLFSSYNSKKYEFEMNYLIEEEKEKRKTEKALKEANEKNEIDLSILGRKLKKLMEREFKINQMIDDLEDSPDIEKQTESYNSTLKRYHDKLESCEIELEEIEDQYDALEVKLEHAKESTP